MRGDTKVFIMAPTAWVFHSIIRRIGLRSCDAVFVRPQPYGAEELHGIDGRNKTLYVVRARYSFLDEVCYVLSLAEHRRFTLKSLDL